MKRWELSHEAFESLLTRLDPTDRGLAAQNYKDLREKLERFFEWRGASNCSELADETLDRVARKLVEGEIAKSLSSYSYGVARMVLLENRRATAALRPIEGEPAHAASADTKDRDRLLTCLESCVAQLPADQRRLILEYYKEEHVGKIEGRKRLAERENVSLNVLRIRACRIRTALQECVRGCAAGGI